jgi:hypothetical protein
MFFQTRAECEEWCAFMGIQLDERKTPSLECSELSHSGSEIFYLTCGFPDVFSKFLWFAETLEEAIQPRNSCLIWMTDYGVFSSSENQHLYYRLRQSYGDLRHLHDAPGHLCLKHERPDAVTLIYLSLLFGWDIHVLPVAGYARLFISNDEWLQIAFSDKNQHDKTKVALEGNGVPIHRQSIKNDLTRGK